MTCTPSPWQIGGPRGCQGLYYVGLGVSEMGNEIVPTVGASPQGGPPARPLAVGGSSLLSELLPRCETSLDLSNPAERRLLALCASSGEADGARAANLTVAVEHYVLRDATRNHIVTGQPERCKLLSLLSPDGEVWHTTSEPCIRSFAFLVVAFGTLPWRPAKLLRVQKVQLGGGKATYTLSEALEGGAP